MGSSFRNMNRILAQATNSTRISINNTSIMKFTLDISPALADEILKLHQIHNRRILDFSKAEQYMERMRYDVADKVMTLITQQVLENSRMLTLKHD